MNIKDLKIESVLLVLFVLGISMAVGWYSEKAVEKYISINKTQSI